MDYRLSKISHQSNKSCIPFIGYFSKSSSNPIFSERKNYLIVLLDLLKNPNGGLPLQFSKSIKCIKTDFTYPNSVFRQRITVEYTKYGS